MSQDERSRYNNNNNNLNNNDRGTTMRNNGNDENFSDLNVRKHDLVSVTRGRGDGGDGGQLASQQYLRQIVEQFPPVIHAFGYGSGVFSQSLDRSTAELEEQSTTSYKQNEFSSNNSSVSQQKHHHHQQQQQQQQQQSASKHGMLDMIFVVDDATEFHSENMRLWPDHYPTWLHYVDGGRISTRGRVCSKLQTQGVRSLLPFAPTNSTSSRSNFLNDAHVLFHVVDKDPAWMKYGVIEKRDIIRDLTDWESLYIAGRMQKPTLAITTMTDELIEAQQKNLNAAAAAALLLSPLYSPTIDEDQYKNIQSLTCMALSWPVFFQTITSISYSGDFRMRMGGEDPQKIQKLVQGPGQLSRFYNLYHPSITKMIESGIVSVIDDNPSMSSMQQHTANNLGRLEWNSNDVSARQQLLSQLSRSVQDTVQRHHQHQMQKYESISSPLSLSDKDVAVALANSLAGIVGPTARNQSFKGMFTLGLRKSIRYASAKLSKGLFRKR